MNLNEIIAYAPNVTVCITANDVVGTIKIMDVDASGATTGLVLAVLPEGAVSQTAVTLQSGSLKAVADSGATVGSIQVLRPVAPFKTAAALASQSGGEGVDLDRHTVVEYITPTFIGSNTAYGGEARITLTPPEGYEIDAGMVTITAFEATDGMFKPVKCDVTIKMYFSSIPSNTNANVFGADRHTVPVVWFKEFMAPSFLEVLDAGVTGGGCHTCNTDAVTGFTYHLFLQKGYILDSFVTYAPKETADQKPIFIVTYNVKKTVNKSAQKVQALEDMPSMTIQPKSNEPNYDNYV